MVIPAAVCKRLSKLKTGGDGCFSRETFKAETGGDYGQRDVKIGRKTQRIETTVQARSR